MNNLTKRISVALFVLVISFAVWQFTFKPSREIILPQGLEFVSITNSHVNEQEYFGDNPKVVGYLYDDCCDVLKWWIPYISKYPEIKFLFYIKSDKREAILNELAANGFRYPVIWDPKGLFAKENGLRKEVAFISYIVNDDNELISTRNPTYGDYEQHLLQVK